MKSNSENLDIIKLAQNKITYKELFKELNDDLNSDSGNI